MESGVEVRRLYLNYAAGCRLTHVAWGKGRWTGSQTNKNWKDLTNPLVNFPHGENFSPECTGDEPKVSS